MSRNDVVSVVIPMYNAEEFIADTVNSVLAQTWRPLDVVIVDDGSTDLSCRRVPAGLREDGVSVQVLSQENRGVSAARNVGAEQSRGRFIAFLDADDLWEPTKVEAQMRALSETPRAGAAVCGYAMFDSTSGQVLGGFSPRWDREFIERWVSLRGRGGLLCSTVLLRKESWERIGPFDEALSTSADADFAMRLIESCPVVALPEHLVHYRLSAHQMHRNLEILERDTQRILRKSYMRDNPELLRVTASNLSVHLDYSRWREQMTIRSTGRFLATSVRHAGTARHRAQRRLASAYGTHQARPNVLVNAITGGRST